MLDELQSRAAGRFVFVVGKGGTGKTTTASALALRSADRGASVHLVSTDPAHSIGDVFRQPLEAAPAPSECNAALVLEAFDARAYAQRWIARAADPIAELVERGTYLDAADARSFLDLSLPGVDEVMAALRLVELSATPTRRIVVDTAPTGHTLRLLDSGKLLESWIAAFRAMARKAGVVASTLMKQHVRFAAESLLDELEAGVRTFEQDVLARADFIIATRPGDVVAAETRRLRDALEQRKLRVAAVVQTGGDAAGANVLVVPLTTQPSGCDGLRGWGRDVGPAPATEAAVPAPAPPAFVRESTHELLFFAGKGGVGKSTCAAACALALAERREVLLVSVDPAGSLEDVLGVPVTRAGSPVTPRLTVMQVDAEAEYAELRDRYRGDLAPLFEQLGIGGDAALDRAVMESLWDLAPPGIDEILALVSILEHVGPDRTLVVDAAPTGHFLRLIELPEIALEWARALMRLLVKHHATLGMEGAAEEVLRLSRNLKALRDMLTHGTRAAAVVVTLDEPVVAAESARLEDALTRAGIAVAARVHNRWLRSTDAVGGGAPDATVDIFAPLLAQPPVGVAQLRGFLARWTQVP